MSRKRNDRRAERREAAEQRAADAAKSGLSPAQRAQQRGYTHVDRPLAILAHEPVGGAQP